MFDNFSYFKFCWLPRKVNGKLVWFKWIEITVSPMEPFEDRMKLL